MNPLSYPELSTTTTIVLNCVVRIVVKQGPLSYTTTYCPVLFGDRTIICEVAYEDTSEYKQVNKSTHIYRVHKNSQKFESNSSKSS